MCIRDSANGWIRQSPVTATFGGSDSGSGVNQLRYWVDNNAVNSTSMASTTASISGEGLHTANLRVLDNAGNISPLTSSAVHIDLTPPVVTVTGVTAGAVYGKGSVPVAGCNTVDALSGVATPATIRVSGGNSNGLGNFTATCSGGTDVAGNVAPAVGLVYHVTLPSLVAGVGTPTVVSKTRVSVPLTLSNSGTGTVTNATIKAITGITVTSGSGTVSVASGLPANLGTLNPGASATTPVLLNWPGTAQRITFKVVFNASGGYTGSTSLALTR